MDDGDAFNPAYDDYDDEADYYLTTLNAQNNAPNEFEEDLNFSTREAEPPAPSNKRSFRTVDENAPFGDHPLDWFARTDMSETAAKRRKKEMAEIKAINLIDRIQSQKTKRTPFGQLINSEANATKVLHFRESDDGVMRVSDVNGVDHSFLGLGKLDEGYKEWKEIVTKRRTALRPVDVEFDAAKLRSQPPPAPTAPVVQPSVPQTSESFKTWSEKYEAQDYLHLLTDDSQNSLVLGWLKAWSRLIFNEKAMVIERIVSNMCKNAFELDEGPTKLPKRKLLVLHGPSGTCKSTLAKVCATQAGYRVAALDMNDYPTPALFLEKLKDVSSSRKFSFTASTHSSKNNVCLIIEGIDGCSKELVNCLVKHLGREKFTKKSLQVPAIIVCNNFYAPALRPLRNVTFAVRLDHVNRKRALQRLEQICNMESLNIRERILAMLFDQCRGDIRQCLSNLQLIASSLQSNGNAEEQVAARIAEYSIFDTFDYVCTTNRHFVKGKLNSFKERANTIYEVLSRRGDLDLVYTGLHFNLQHLGKLRPPQRLKIINWFAEAIKLQCFINKTQRFDLMKYMTATAIQIHLDAAFFSTHPIKWDLSFMRFRDRQRECASIIDTVFGWELDERESRKDDPKNKKVAKSEDAVAFISIAAQFDTLSALVRILQPNCAVKTSHANKSSSEMEVVNRVVALMRRYGFRFATQIVDGNPVSKLDPPIEMVVGFPYVSSKLASHGLTNAMKSFISQQLAHVDAKPSAQHLAQKPQQPWPKKRRSTHDTNATATITPTMFIYKHGHSRAVRSIVRNRDFFL